MICNNPHTTYTSPAGRPFRVLGMERVPNTDKWIDKVLKWHWCVLIKFLDTEESELLRLFYGYDDKIYKKDLVE